MSEQTTLAAVRQTVTVNVPVERAFRVFTEGFSTWWPATHHIAEVEMAEAIIEGRTGGRWYEKGIDGSECEWGHVIAWDPPEGLVLSWRLNGAFQYDPDPTRWSEVEIRFIAEGDAATRVELEHRCIERHGDTAEALRTGVSGPGGWPGILALYAGTLAA
jgi:uncharacterized protein YndB with AHSA1/START domain